MYLIKQLVGALANPLIAAVLVAALGAAYRARGSRRTATWFFAIAPIVAFLGSSTLVGDALLGPLERRYPPFRQDSSSQKIGYVVVLGAGYAPRAGIPITASLDENALVRIVEGVRLVRQLGGVKLIVSGGGPRGLAPSAHGYAHLARDLGINDASLVVLSESLDTSAEAQTVASRLARAPFLLVTSAYHMPRAMRRMVLAGGHPIPAPTGHRVSGIVGWRSLLPTSRGLSKTELALHEYLGLAALAAGLD